MQFNPMYRLPGNMKIIGCPTPIACSPSPPDFPYPFENHTMDGLQQIGLPLVGIVAAAALTFYAVSFNELREKSFTDLEEREDSEGSGGFKSSLSSREKRARRKAEKQSKS